MSQYGIPDRLATAETVRATTQQPVLRIRNEHSCTLKDGWRLSSSTVEVTYPLGPYSKEDAKYVLEEMQRHAFEVGQAEAVRRNQEGHSEVIQ